MITRRTREISRSGRLRVPKACCSARHCSDGEDDLSLRSRSLAFEHEMSFARIRERQYYTNTCFQLSLIYIESDLRQMAACDVDKKEGGFDAMELRKILIGT